MLAKYNDQQELNQNISLAKNIPIPPQGFNFQIPSVQILTNPYGSHNIIISEQKISPSVLGIEHHKTNVASTSSILQKCHICHKQFDSVISLNSHIKQHVDEKGTTQYRNYVVTTAPANLQTSSSPAPTTIAITSAPSSMQSSGGSQAVNSVNKHHQTIEYQIANSIANNHNEKEYHKSNIAHTSTASLSDVIISKSNNHIDYATAVANLNLHVQQQVEHQQSQVQAVIQTHQNQQQSQQNQTHQTQTLPPHQTVRVEILREKVTNSPAKQNPVEYHIQQQQHAAMVVASMNQSLAAKGGLSNPFLNSTIKYELHTASPPVQLVTEVHPYTQMIADSSKSDDMNSSPSSVSSPASVHQTNNSTPTPSTSASEAVPEKQHKCQLW